MKKNNAMANAGRSFWKHRWLYLFTLPGVVYFLVFAYFPMLGSVMAFQNFDPILGFAASEFVGFENFRTIFCMPEFLSAFRNTVIISALKLVIGFPATILFALLINEIQSVHLKKSIQTISYIPYFISWVTVAGIWYKFLSVDSGLINEILMSLGLTADPVFFFGESKYFYIIVLFADLWKNLGFGAIIYLAALSGVDQELYEAAEMDGAGRLKRIWHISLPGIKGVIVLMLVLNSSSLMNAGFDQLWTFGNINIRNVSEILDTLVLRTLTTSGVYGMSTGAAMGLFQSFVGLVLFLLANGTTRLLGEDTLL